MAGDISTDQDDGPPYGRGALLFPAAGVVAGLAAFLALSLFWPDARQSFAITGGTSGTAVQAQSSGHGTAGSAGVRDVEAVAGDGSATVSWAAPAGVQAAQYTVQAVPENTALPMVQCSTAGLSCTLAGMTDGATYTLQVSARTTAGTTTAPVQAQVTPYPAVLTGTSTVLWLNADDVPAAPGAPVSQWPDASGQHNGATQPTAAAQPVMAALGSHRALKFSGAQSLLLDGRRLPTGNTPAEVFAVTELQDPDAATACFEHVIAWGTPETGEARMLYKGCGTQLAYADTFNTYPLMNPATVWPHLQPTLVSAAFAPSGVTVRLDGSADYTWPRPADVNGDTVPQSAAMIGGAPWWGAKDGWKGLIGEVIVLSGPVSSATQQAVEHYLTRKWGVPTP